MTKIGYITLPTAESMQSRVFSIAKSSWLDQDTQRQYFGRAKACGENIKKLMDLEREILAEVKNIKERFESSGAFKVRW